MIELNTNRDQIVALLNSDSRWHQFQGIIRAKAEQPDIYSELVKRTTTFYSNIVNWVKIFHTVKLERSKLDTNFEDATQEYFNFLTSKARKNRNEISINRLTLVTFPNDFSDELVKSITFDLPEHFAGYSHDPVRLKLCYYLLAFQKISSEELSNALKLLQEDNVLDEFQAQYALFINEHKDQVLTSFKDQTTSDVLNLKLTFTILNNETNKHHLYRRARKCGYNPLEALDYIREYFNTLETNNAEIKYNIELLRKYNFIEILNLTSNLTRHEVNELNLNWLIQNEPEIFLNWIFDDLDNLGNYYIHLNYSAQQLYQILQPTWEIRINDD